MALSLRCLALTAILLSVGACARAGDEPVATTGESRDETAISEQLRLAGAFDEAIAAAEQALGQPGLPADRQVAWRVELARTHDRVSLHRNTRPSVAALRELERAHALAESLGPAARADLEAQWASYHYRAESEERRFPRATEHAERALGMYAALGDAHGQADMVHLLGLFHFQKRELEPARRLFDESLELDRAGGPRDIFLGDYHRHVGYLHFFADDLQAALPHFEKSLEYRERAGATDQSLFAAWTLGALLVEVGRHEEARGHLLYAMEIARRLDSPVGRCRVGFATGRLHEARNEADRAERAYRETLAVAESVSYRSIAKQARDALRRLAEGGPG